MNQIKPYTYLIKFKPTGQVYYGSRVKNVRLKRTPEEDLMKHYFTSCKTIKKLVKEFGIDNFEWEIRKTFENINEAARWEQKVLQRMNVVKDPRWFNQNANGYIVPTPEGLAIISATHKGKPKPQSQKDNISKALTGVPKSEEACKNMSISQLARDCSGPNHPLFGVARTEEQNAHHSKMMKGKVRNIDDETRQYLSELFSGDNNPGKNKSDETRKLLSEASKGKYYVHTADKGKYIKPEELDKYIADGWKRGRRTKFSGVHGLKGKSKTQEHCDNLSKSHTGKTRDTNKVAKGERCAKAKLTSSQVLDIRYRYANRISTQSVMAKEFNVTLTNINNIIHRKIWKHI